MPDADLELLLSCLREAGALALSFPRPKLKFKNKPDGTFVTEVDEAVDELLKARITAARPDDGWLSEETPDNIRRLTKNRLWISDPIDGTKGFLHSTGPWGIGMALIADGAPQIAALLRPDDGQMFHAVKGQGCFCNGVALNLSSPASRAVITPKRYTAALQAHDLLPETDSPIPLLLRLASIAAGHHLGAISFGNKSDWDIAAGHLLVTEIGGKVSRLDGSPVIYNQPNPWQPGLIAAASEEAHALILNVVRQ